MTTLNKSIYLKANKELVWEYLTDPDKLAIWFHKPETRLADGQPYEVLGQESGERIMWGNVIHANPHDLLEYTFTITPMGDAVSTVKWTLEDVPGGTRLSLEHSDLPLGVPAFDLTLALDKGWDDHLDRMRADVHSSN